MKKTTSKKPKQQKQVKVPRLVSLGKADFEFVLHLPEEALPYYNTEWDKINEFADLAFIKDNKDLWDRIQLISNNNLVNTLLFVNKSNLTKTFVEVVLLNPLKFAENEIFLKEIITYVTERNFLFIEEKADILESENKIVFTIKSGKKVKSFGVCKEEKKEKAQIGNKPQEKPEEEKKENEVENTNAHKQGANQPKESGKGKDNDDEGPFANFTQDIQDYDYFLFDLDEFTPFLAENPLILTHFANFLEKKILPHKNLKIAINFPDLIKSITNFDLDTVNIISELLSASDVVIFDKKPAHSLFNMLHKISNISESSNAPVPDLEEKEVPNYFAYGIKPMRSNNRRGIFISELQKLSVIDTSGTGSSVKINFQSEFDFELYPRINHTNQKLVSVYKSLLSDNYDQLRSVFLGSFLSRILTATTKKINKEILLSFLSGCEASKRILELHRNKMDLPFLNDFYVVKISHNKIEKELEVDELKKKESKFVLDCVNRNTSNLKYYNPLFDDHLNSFFASEVIRKQLKSKGFINTNGFIMYDANYRACMGASPKRKRYDEEEKEKQLIYAIKSINVVEDPHDKSHFDSYSRMMNSNSPTNRKLPSLSFEYPNANILAKSTSSKTSKKKLKPLDSNSNHQTIEQESKNQQEREGRTKEEKELVTSGNKTEKVPEKTQKTDKTVDKQEKTADKTEKVADKTEKVADKTEKVADKTEKVADKTEKVVEKTDGNKKSTQIV